MIRHGLSPVIVMTVLASGALSGQSRGTHDVEQFVSFQGSELLTQPSYHYRAWDEPEVLLLSFAFVNRLPDTVQFSQSNLSGIGVRVLSRSSNTLVPVITQTLPGVVVPDRVGVTRAFIDGPVTVAPSTAAEWTIGVKQQDGRRFAGDYTVVVNVPDVNASVRLVDGGSIVAASERKVWEMSLVARVPSDSTERVSMLRFQARDALSRRDYDEAVRALLEIRSEFPDDLSSKLEHADALHLAGRFGEAIAQYEQLLPLLRGSAQHERRWMLARLYMRARDEANAVRLMKEDGLNEDGVRQALKVLRDSLEDPALQP